MSPASPAGETAFPSIQERIARAIHERYRRNQRGRKPDTDPAMAPWDELVEALKRSNRGQAADIEHKLRRIGYTILSAPGDGAGASPTPQEWERLAELEHERWVAERRAAGWTLGQVKDVQRKITPYLVSWEELSEEVRDYDREAVRAIPDILADAGLGMVRVSSAPRPVSDAG